MEIITPEAAGERVKKFVEQLFPDCITLETFGGHQKFHVLRSLSQVQSISLGDIFHQFEANKKELQIEEYSISQMTLEQIFIRFAKQQIEEANSK